MTPTPDVPATSNPDPTDLTLSEEHRKELIGWAARCVARLLPIFYQHRPADQRLDEALAAVEKFHDNTFSVGQMRTLAFGCHAAARDCTNAQAKAVARACGQAIAIAHMGGHARNLARYTRQALADPSEELAWQREQLPSHLQDYVYRT